jgi:hypothetical protein
MHQMRISLMLRPNNLEIRNNEPEKSKQRAMKLSQIHRRIELCMREIILRFEMNSTFFFLGNSINIRIFKQVPKYLATELGKPSGIYNPPAEASTQGLKHRTLCIMNNNGNLMNDFSPQFSYNSGYPNFKENYFKCWPSCFFSIIRVPPTVHNTPVKILDIVFFLIINHDPWTDFINSSQNKGLSPSCIALSFDGFDSISWHSICCCFFPALS